MPPTAIVPNRKPYASYKVGAAGSARGEWPRSVSKARRLQIRGQFLPRRPLQATRWALAERADPSVRSAIFFGFFVARVFVVAGVVGVIRMFVARVVRLLALRVRASPE